MKLPLEDHLPYAVLALTVLVLFYGIYFAKMLAQKQRGIQTRQIKRRKEKSIHTVELLIERVLVYPDKHIEIAYKIQDIFD